MARSRPNEEPIKVIQKSLRLSSQFDDTDPFGMADPALR
jgi:hypothetical protein